MVFTFPFTQSTKPQCQSWFLCQLLRHLYSVRLERCAAALNQNSGGFVKVWCCTHFPLFVSFGKEQNWYFWWFGNLATWLKLEVYLTICKALYIPGGAEFFPISSREGWSHYDLMRDGLKDHDTYIYIYIYTYQDCQDHILNLASVNIPAVIVLHISPCCTGFILVVYPRNDQNAL